MDNNLELIKENCIFCKIVKGEIESYKTYEDNICTCILDINPVSDGHTLLIPKEHYMMLPLVPDEVLNHLSMVIKTQKDIMKERLDCEDVEIFIANGPAAGQQSHHFLIHLIPKYDEENIIINTEEADENELQEIYEKLKENFAKKE